MIRLNILISILIIVSLETYSQFAPVNDIPFTQWGQEISAPLSGGLSAAQFSEIDLNNDGIQDLFIFDRGAQTFITLLNDGSGNFTYTAEYQHIFPPLEDWVLLRDFNCDNIPDIFTYSIGSTKVYKGILIGGVLSFELEKEIIIYTNDAGIEVPVYTSRPDIAGFDDIDNDGDLDILSFSVSNTTIRFYQNISAESGYGCDSLIYIVGDYCWGAMYEGFTCDGATLHVVCKGADEVISETKKMHVGSTIVTFDKDGDGDMDAVIGDNSCNNLVYYRNGGSFDYAEMDDKDSTFPKNTINFNMPTFPAAYLIDVDNDGDKDMLATTNDHLLGLNTQHIWLYENLNTNDTFHFVFKTDTFLISQMVDAGGYSKPVFLDYNSDGLLDILIGVGFTYGKDLEFKKGLWLYKNIGTINSPAFELVTTDYAGLNIYNFDNLAPIVIDIDNDGDEDLFCGTKDGNIAFLENIAGTGEVAAYASIQYPYQLIDVGAYATPFFIDVDNDGLIDLVCGEQNGNLNYYKNIGSATDPNFVLESENWGGVDVRKLGFITGHSSPFLYRNENDSLYLLVGSQSGHVFEFNEIEDALEGEFFESDTNYLTLFGGIFSTVNGADLNNDGFMDYLTGNTRGGIMIYEHDFTTDIADINKEKVFEIFPNPVSDVLQVQFIETNISNATLKIFSSTGILLLTKELSTNEITIPLNNLTTQGIYIISITTDNLTASKVFIKL